LSETFYFRKWYFDCVSPEGDAAILYLAHFCWRSTALHYSSLLLSRNEKVTTRTSMRRFKPFNDASNPIELTLPYLDVFATFTAEQSVVHQSVLPGVEWFCLQPRSHAAIVVDGFTLLGLGYGERLDLTVPPWKLQIGELHWGHFLSVDDSLVWIRIKGLFPTIVALHNGHDVTVDHVDASKIRFESGATLDLERHQTLRTGRLCDTVLPAAPVLEKFFPRSILNLRETKWCSHGTLDGLEHRSTGWAIHEVIEWPT